jgi:hypothetical protein
VEEWQCAGEALAISRLRKFGAGSSSALKKNAPMAVLNHAAGQHGFDARDNNPRTRDILRRTLEFIQEP